MFRGVFPLPGALLPECGVVQYCYIVTGGAGSLVPGLIEKRTGITPERKVGFYLLLVPGCLAVVSLRLLDRFYCVELCFRVVGGLLDYAVNLPFLVRGVVKIDGLRGLPFDAITSCRAFSGFGLVSSSLPGVGVSVGEESFYIYGKLCYFRAAYPSAREGVYGPGVELVSGFVKSCKIGGLLVLNYAYFEGEDRGLLAVCNRFGGSHCFGVLFVESCITLQR